jgi:hypothetical protein
MTNDADSPRAYNLAAAKLYDRAARRVGAAIQRRSIKIIAEDQLKTDIFYRFNQSIQAFFNEAAGVPTEFVEG